MHDEWIKDAIAEAMKKAGDDMLAKAFGIPWSVAGDSRNYAGSGYIIYEELGKMPNIVESTAIVIDEQQPALPAPKEVSNER